MKNWIIGAAAVLAVLAPNVAAAQTGYVGAVYANTEVDGADDVDAYGVEGSAFFQGSGTIGFEVDAAVLDNDDSDTGYGLTGHVFTRNDRYLFGGFVGVADSGDDSTTVSAGVEANKYYDRWTLFGALSYATNDDTDADGYGVNIGASLFPTDNFRIDGSIGLASVEVGSNDDDATSLGVGAEYQFASLPISVGASYTHVEFDDANVESDTLGLTVRYNWGGTLFDRDRSGASQAGRAGLGSLL